MGLEDDSEKNVLFNLRLFIHTKAIKHQQKSMQLDPAENGEFLHFQLSLFGQV